MDDRDALLWNTPPPPRQQAKPGELLFEFVRASDGAPVSRDVRFHDDSYGWEPQFFERAS